MSDITLDDIPTPSELVDPWYRDPSKPHPFVLRNKIPSHNSTPLCAVALCPWSVDSLEKLWSGDLDTPELRPQWRNMVETWSGAIAVGGMSRIHVWTVLKSTKPIIVRTPHDQGYIKCVAWALSPSAPVEPLVVFSGTKIVYVLNVHTRKLISYLRGHGGAVTSIDVHQTYPYIFCTSSKDQTTRIYDLTLTPTQGPSNPPWPPGTAPTLAGPAHGLQMTDPEGDGIGRCVAVLCGSKSGGHLDAVLGAAFHPSHPLIATCGRDRDVKIWRLPQLSENLAREDKPIFSTSKLHKARVCSINWVSQDILVTHSAPAFMRRSDDNPEVYLEDGVMVVWQWQGLGRYFPPEFHDMGTQKAMRGCASDYQESSSFKIISVTALPIIPTPHSHISRSPHLHFHWASHEDPLVLLSFSTTRNIRILNLISLPSRKPPPFPGDLDMIEMARRMTLSEDQEQGRSDANDPVAVVDERPELQAWNIAVSEDDSNNETIEACAMGLDGMIIVGVGSQGTTWVWVKQCLNSIET